jgi:hypothetical protein
MPMPPTEHEFRAANYALEKSLLDALEGWDGGMGDPVRQLRDRGYDDYVSLGMIFEALHHFDAQLDSAKARMSEEEKLEAANTISDLIVILQNPETERVRSDGEVSGAQLDGVHRDSYEEYVGWLRSFRPNAPPPVPPRRGKSDTMRRIARMMAKGAAGAASGAVVGGYHAGRRAYAEEFDPETSSRDFGTKEHHFAINRRRLTRNMSSIDRSPESVQAYLGVTKRDALEVFELMEAADAADPSDVDRVLARIDRVMEAYGVESLEGPSWRRGPYGNIVALYVNTGDPWTPTVIYDTTENEFQLTTVGDWVEDYERKSGPLP